MEAISRVEQVPTVSTSSVIGKDQRVYLVAKRDKTIIECTREELKEVLRMICIKIGIRAKNIPVEEEKEVLCQYIVRNYSTYTIAELSFAFELAVSGKLILEDGYSVNCYENFSCLYLSGIMNAYRDWARTAYKGIVQAIPEEPQRIYTDTEILNQRRAEIEDAFQAMKDGRYPIIHIYFEEVLRWDGLLKEGVTVSDFFVKVLGSPQITNLYVREGL